MADSVLGAFNSKNSKLFNDPFSGEVAIINGFASLGWTGPNAQARWWAEAERWGEELGVASEHISVEKTLHCEAVATRGYAVLSATLTIALKKGESIIGPGILICTLIKLGGEWKAVSQTWGRQIEGDELVASEDALHQAVLVEASAGEVRVPVTVRQSHLHGLTRPPCHRCCANAIRVIAIDPKSGRAF